MSRYLYIAMLMTLAAVPVWGEDDAGTTGRTE
jgi:hypothetical protein